MLGAAESFTQRIYIEDLMESLNDALLAHQIATIKHAAELGQSVVPYLNEVKAIILQAHPAPAPEKPAGIGDNRRES